MKISLTTTTEAEHSRSTTVSVIDAPDDMDVIEAAQGLFDLLSASLAAQGYTPASIERGIAGLLGEYAPLYLDGEP